MMKAQVAWSFHRSRTELVVRPQRRELLDLASAEWLRDSHCDYLLPVEFEYALARSKNLRLRYDITGLVTLKRLLRQVWTLEAYFHILDAIAASVLECSGSSHPLERMLFDADHIYLTEDGQPQFIYIPLEGMAFDSGANTPLAILDRLSDVKRMRFDSMDARAIAQSLRQHVVSHNTFSLNDYGRFLDQEFPRWRTIEGAGASTEKANADTRSASGLDADKALFLDSLFSSFDDRDSQAKPSIREEVSCKAPDDARILPHG